MFNAAFFSSPVMEVEEDLGRRLKLAWEVLGAQGGRWAFWACADRMAGDFQGRTARMFRRFGLAPVLRHPALYCDAMTAASADPPPLEYRTVEERAARTDFSRINSHAFRIPFAWCQELYDIDALWGRDFTGYVGYAGGRAVCCAATLAAAGVIGVYSVATLPGEERKGYGEAITRHVVAAAQRETGLARSILQSTREGLGLYQRLGYRMATHFVVYSN
jgi:GNAT superfamily N-acetyltransferase